MDVREGMLHVLLVSSIDWSLVGIREAGKERSGARSRSSDAVHELGCELWNDQGLPFFSVPRQQHSQQQCCQAVYTY